MSEGRVIVGRAPVHRTADPNSPLDTHYHYGERVTVLDKTRATVHCRSAEDGYEGYVAARQLGAPAAATHYVAGLGAYIYRVPDLRAAPLDYLPRHSPVAVAETGIVTRDTEYARLDPAGFLPLVLPVGGAAALARSGRGGRTLSRRAVSVGRAQLSRARLLGAGAAGFPRPRRRRAARHRRPARGDREPRRGRASPGRPHLHPRPCDDLRRRRHRHSRERRRHARAARQARRLAARSDAVRPETPPA